MATTVCPCATQTFSTQVQRAEPPWFLWTSFPERGGGVWDLDNHAVHRLGLLQVSVHSHSKGREYQEAPMWITQVSYGFLPSFTV